MFHHLGIAIFMIAAHLILKYGCVFTYVHVLIQCLTHISPTSAQAGLELKITCLSLLNSEFTDRHYSIGTLKQSMVFSTYALYFVKFIKY